jgi:glycosyltransferase involved in cell wall biosynthesis
MQTNLVIFAINIKGQGSAQVLKSFATEAAKSNFYLEIHITDRGIKLSNLSANKNFKLVKYSESFLVRIFYQCFFGLGHYRNNVLVFGDLPILFKSHYLLCQNKLVFDKNYSSWKLKIFRLFFRFGVHWSKLVFVQTSHMKVIFKKLFDNPVKIVRHPSARNNLKIDTASTKKIIFCPTSNYYHKNNDILFNITVPVGYSLYATLEPTNKDLPKGVHFIGAINSNVVDEILKTDCVVLVTSSIESYSIPLVEATELGLRFVCPESDYASEFSAPTKFSFHLNDSKSLEMALRAAVDYNGERVCERYFWDTMLNEFK